MFEAIRSIFLSRWNPIGAPLLSEQEYDRFVPEILRMLLAGASEEAIAEKLEDFEMFMRSGTSGVQRLDVAHALKALTRGPQVPILGLDGP
ncbi:MAG TPA: hypothetical protein VGF86_13980 [Candidatus Tumulicola sp.]